MSVSTPASQTILYRFQTPLVGGDLAQLNAGVLYEGIYSGLVATAGGGAAVNISAGTCLIFDSASYGTPSAKLVKVEFGVNFSFTMDSGAKYRYLVIRYLWLPSTSNYATITETNTPVASDIILCAVEWSGSTISLVDTASATMGFRGKFDGIINNLAPTANPTTPLTLNIAAGRFVYSHTSTPFTGGSVTLSASTSGRYDLVGINTTGIIVVIQGTEGGSAPPFTTMLPVAVVHVRPGVSSFLQSDILDVRPFLTFGGTFKAIDITTDLTGLTNIPSGIATIQDLLSWVNTHFYDGTILNVHALAGSTRTTILGSDDTTIPTSLAVKTYADAQMAAEVERANLAYQTLGDSGYAKSLSRINFLLNKDVGKVAFFAAAKALSTGWIRADGTLLDKSVNPEYGALVDCLRAEAGADATHPYYQNDGAVVGNTNKVYLPNLKDYYMKDTGTSGGKNGARVTGGIQQHSHTDTVSTSSTPDHTHPMGHIHPLSGSTGPTTPNGSVTIPAHTHTASVPPHKHVTHIGTGLKDAWGGGHYNDGNHSPSPFDQRVSFNDDFNSGTEIPAAGGVFGTPDTSLPVTVAAAALSGTVAVGAHTHTLPTNTDATATTTTGSPSTPDNHSHTVTINNTGTDTLNEVYHVNLLAYVYYGPTVALM